MRCYSYERVCMVDIRESGLTSWQLFCLTFKFSLKFPNRHVDQRDHHQASVNSPLVPLSVCCDLIWCNLPALTFLCRKFGLKKRERFALWRQKFMASIHALGLETERVRRLQQMQSFKETRLVMLPKYLTLPVFWERVEIGTFKVQGQGNGAHWIPLILSHFWQKWSETEIAMCEQSSLKLRLSSPVALGCRLRVQLIRAVTLPSSPISGTFLFLPQDFGTQQMANAISRGVSASIYSGV